VVHPFRTGSVEIQIETHPGGQPPFLIEGPKGEQALETSDLTEASATIVAWLLP
jgi:hypothetical protein